MSCEVFNARSNLPPNGCTTRNNEWPVDCLTEFAGGRQTIAAAASYTYRFALDRSGMVIADLVADGIPQGDAASGDLQITQISVDGNNIWPKTVSAVTANNNAVQTVPLDAIRREAVYWFGGGAMGTGTPFGAILRSIGPLARDKGIAITVTNAGSVDHTVPNLSLVMALDAKLSKGDA